MEKAVIVSYYDMKAAPLSANPDTLGYSFNI